MTEKGGACSAKTCVTSVSLAKWYAFKVVLACWMDAKQFPDRYHIGGESRNLWRFPRDVVRPREVLLDEMVEFPNYRVNNRSLPVHDYMRRSLSQCWNLMLLLLRRTRPRAEHVEQVHRPTRTCNSSSLFCLPARPTGEGSEISPDLMTACPAWATAWESDRHRLKEPFRAGWQCDESVA